MSISSLFPGLASLRRSLPSTDEFEALLDYFPQAALLLDMQKERVLLANARAAELTLFTREELSQIQLPKLFPGLFPREFPADKNLTVDNVPSPIITRNGGQIEALINLHWLGDSRSWMLVTFEPAEITRLQMAERQRHGQRLHDLNDLLEALQIRELSSAVQAVFQAGHRLTGASILALYLVDGQAPGLHLRTQWGPADHLPESLLPSDVESFLEPKLWVSGKRVSNSLLRMARTSQMSYLAHAPLGQPGAFTGLLVIADTNVTPPVDALLLIQLLSSTLTTIFEYHTMLKNLEAELHLRRKDIKFSEATKDAIQEGVITLSPSLTIKELNPAAELILGYAGREVDGQPIENVLIGANNLTSALQDAKNGIPTHSLGNLHLHRRDGGAFPAHMRILPVLIADQLEGILVVFRDLSEHEQFQLRTQQLEQRALLGEVMAIFAHEVRNPINNISTGLQLMAYNLPEDDPHQELIVRLENDCKRLEHLMQSVLAFSRPAKSESEELDLGLFMHRLIERWRPRLAKVNIKPNIQISPDAPKIMGDPRSLEQVFTNLISNAVQAMSESGGTLSVNVRPVLAQGDRPYVEVSVSDSGPGIPESNREKIFEPFFTTKTDGTGLGLPITKRIVTAHKGTIRLNSVPGGTVFQVQLPVIEEDNPTE